MLMRIVHAEPNGAVYVAQLVTGDANHIHSGAQSDIFDVFLDESQSTGIPARKGPNLPDIHAQIFLTCLETSSNSTRHQLNEPVEPLAKLNSHNTSPSKQAMVILSTNLTPRDLSTAISKPRQKIEDVEYFITKANNLTYKCRIAIEDDRDFCLASLSSLECSIRSQLIQVSQALINFTNVCIPLETCMDVLKIVEGVAAWDKLSIYEHLADMVSTSLIIMQDSEQYVEHLLELIKNFSTLVKSAFGDDPQFLTARDKAFKTSVFKLD
uniref:FANCI_S4 domain-containing protein n=1 Tax=Glossina pallidipes TaxID=7398 RepID=A0A1B0AC93_GLOPL